RAFQHLYTVEDQLACLACVRRHLVPGGTVAFDVFAPRLDWLAPHHELEREDAPFERDRVEVTRYAKIHRRPAQQIEDVAFGYVLRRSGIIVGEETVAIRMRYFFRYEVEHLLARAGFADITVYGGFDRRPYDYTSGETIVVAR